jgi:hypothetical protein
MTVTTKPLQEHLPSVMDNNALLQMIVYQALVTKDYAVLAMMQWLVNTVLVPLALLTLTVSLALVSKAVVDLAMTQLLD